MSRLGPALAALLLFLGLGLSVLGSAVFSDKVMSTADGIVRNGPFPAGMAGEERLTRGLGDQHRAFEPWLRFAADEYAETGRLPLWKDRSFCGAPLLGNGQSALFFPPTMLGVALGAPPWYQGALGLLKLVLGAWFAFRLARHLGVSSEGAWITGITFAFFGFHIAWLTFPLTNVAFLLPAVLLCADRAVLRPTGRRIALLALVTGLQHTGGHPETTFQTQAFAGLMVLVRAASLRGLPRRPRVAACARRDRRLRARRADRLRADAPLARVHLPERQSRAARGGSARAPGALRGAVGERALRAGAPALGTRRGSAHGRQASSVRVGLLLLASVGAMVVAGMESMFTTNFMCVLSADWQGGRFQPRSESFYMRASVVYVGPAIALAVAGMLFGRPRPLIRIAGGFFVLLLLAGLRAPFVLHLFDSLPVFSLAVNANLVLLSNLCAAVLAGFGLDAVSDAAARERPRERFLWAVLAPTLGLLAALVFGVTHGAIGAALRPRRTPRPVPCLRSWSPRPSIRAGA